MTKHSLDGAWSLTCGLETGSGEREGFKTIPATVPGNVELDLMKAGDLPDLLIGTNVLKARPYEFYEWTYERAFEVPAAFKGRRVELVFGGVDCIATYVLNGCDIGRSDNMFIEHRFDVTEHLRFGAANTLSVRIGSAVNHARTFAYEPSVSAAVWHRESLFVRKAAHAYGWDIMPRLVSAGIWRSVELVAHEPTELTGIHAFTLQAGANQAARIAVRYAFATDAAILEGFEIRVRGVCGDSSFERRAEAPFTVGELQIDVAQAKRWWPRDYGDPALYDTTVDLLRGGQVVDTRTLRVGIRTVELVRSEITTRDKPGEFLFKVNGEPIFCKGSNWVPLHPWHSQDAGRYRAALDLFKDTHCNIVRCWGGNVYEDDAFFDLCDEYGIMVWQDFAMACARYPQDAAFCETLRQEAAAVIRKLRNHPSLVLWAGDNECDQGWNGYRDPNDNRLTRQVLPEAVFAHDFRRPYLPSSPYTSPEVVRLGRDESLQPEQHLWGPRDYYKSRFYAESTAHFASEIGYHGCPNLSSIRRFIDAAHLWPWQDNEQWRIHCTDATPRPGPFAYRVKLMADQIRELFGFQPDNLEDFALASQISQAEAKKFFIEMFRLGKWRRTGIIWWNMLDGWPQFSDAVVDYYFGKKLAYHYIKRVQQPVCVMMQEPADWSCGVVVGNDTREDAAGTLRIWDADSGATLVEGPFAAKANANLAFGRIPVSHSDRRLFLMEWEVAGRKYGNHYLLGKPPIPFAQYRKWLAQIAALPDGFDAAAVGR